MSPNDSPPPPPPPHWSPPPERPASTPIPGTPEVSSPAEVSAPAAVSTTVSPRTTVIATVLSIGFLGAFAWFIVGIVGYNAASGFGPRVTEPAEILSIERDFGTGTSRSLDPTLWVEGETESGRSWRMAAEQAYEAAVEQGYPLDVEVVISTWTGSTLAVRGEGFSVDRSGRGHAIGWLVATAILAAIVLASAWLLARKQSVLAAVVFVLASPVGLWLGFIAMRAIRS